MLPTRSRVTRSEFHARGSPTLCCKSLRDVVEPLAVHAKVAIANAGRTLDGDTVALHTHLQVIDKGLTAIEKSGKVANSRHVLDARVALIGQLVDDQLPATLVHVILPLFRIGQNHLLQGGDSIAPLHTTGPLPWWHLVLAL